MPKTVVGASDPKAVKKYSALLALDVAKKGYFSPRLMGVGEESMTPIQALPHLEKDAGDQVSYDLVMQLKMKPVQGDNNLRNREEDLKFYTDNLLIDQLRGGVNTGGKMTRKRTIHDLRKVARTRQSEWWARLFDETLFMYLSGARGVNPDYLEGPDFTGYAGNALVPPDSMHILYAGGTGSAKSSLKAIDYMSLDLIDRAVARAEVMGGGTTGIPAMQAVMIDGEEHFVLVMHPWCEHDLRTKAGLGTWLDIQKALATSEGRNSPICKGALGLHNNVILHKHRNIVRFDDYGAGNNIAAARNLLLGRQAGVVAFGSPGTGLRFDWKEETEDRSNQVVITTASIFGVKKSRFTIEGNHYDFGVMALDCAAAEP